MKNKKKYIIAAVMTIIVCLLITLPPTIQKEIQKIKQEDYINKTQQALINAGYSEAHKNSFGYTIYLDNTETTSIDILTNDTPSIHNLNKESDLASILDAIMPIWDNDFHEGDGNKVVQGIAKRRYTYDSEMHGGDFSYHNCDYSESLDDTETYTTSLFVFKL